jgi:hypothetical protein
MRSATACTHLALDLVHCALLPHMPTAVEGVGFTLPELPLFVVDLVQQEVSAYRLCTALQRPCAAGSMHLPTCCAVLLTGHCDNTWAGHRGA